MPHSVVRSAPQGRLRHTGLSGACRILPFVTENPQRNSRRVRDIQAAPSRMKDLSQSGHPAIKGVLAFLSALILVISGAGYFSVGRLGGSLSASELQLDRDRNVEVLDGAVDILLVGSDSRSDAQGNPLSEEELARLNAGVAEGEINTDTIMVLRIPEDGSSATAVSICLLYTSPSPRD